MSEFTPVQYLSKIQKLKYRAAFLPILLVFLSFGINMIFKVDQAKYFSVIGLLWYISVIMKFRIKRAYPQKNETETILSPIHGKIVNIKKNIITIKKGIFQSADIRFAGKYSDVKIKSKQISYFEKDSFIAGKLIGINPSSAICICSFPNDWKVNVKINENVIAGETILAEK